MCGYHILSSEIPGELGPKAVFAKKIFKTHQRAMRGQGLISKLRYVGIGMSVYARRYTKSSASDNDRTSQHSDALISPGALDDDFELAELDSEEAHTFDFIKTLEKISYH